MCKPAAPAAPDYAGAATAQGAANVDAATATGHINNPNVINPYGSQSTVWGGNWDQTGYQKALDKYNTDLSSYNSAPGTAPKPNPFPRGSDLWKGYNSNALAGKLPGTKGPAPTAPDKKTFGYDPTSATLTQTLNPTQQGLLDQQNAIKGLLGGLGIQGANSLQGVIGNKVDFSGAPAVGSGQQTRDQVINAMLSRSNQDLGKQWDQNNSDLIARGITPGSAAYQREQDMHARAQNDAEQQAILAGGNAAQQQQGMDVQARNEYISNLLAQRQTPLNEISALMSGSQVNNPFAGNLGYQAGANVQPAPIMQGVQNQYGAGMDAYNRQSSNYNNVMQGLFGLGAAGVTKSDRRLKKNIERIGTHHLGIGIYSFDYIWDEPSIGVMADEVEKVMPEAVLTGSDGYKLVDYSMIGGYHA